MYVLSLLIFSLTRCYDPCSECIRTLGTIDRSMYKFLLSQSLSVQWHRMLTFYLFWCTFVSQRVSLSVCPFCVRGKAIKTKLEAYFRVNSPFLISCLILPRFSWQFSIEAPFFNSKWNCFLEMPQGFTQQSCFSRKIRTDLKFVFRNVQLSVFLDHIRKQIN